MKKFKLFLMFLCISLLANAQSTINITTSGGQYAGEKWVSITTAVDGGGTQVWGQGNGTYANSPGLINQDVVLTPGTYYVNCYDSYADSWDGTLISVTAYGAVLSDNGGATPDDGTDDDASGGFNDTQAQELEASLMIVVPNPPSCQEPANLTVSNINATTADLNWAAGASGESAWEYVLLLATDPAPTTGTGTATTTFNATGLTDATDYVFYVRADCTGGSYSTWASVPFTTYTPVAGDTCDIALPIACGGSETGTTVGATSLGEPSPCGGVTAGAPGVWYNFTGNGDLITASLCNSSFDTKIQIYSGTCGTLTCVDANDDACAFQSEVTFVSTNAVEYYIYINGYGASDVGAYQLDITCVTPPPPPANDDCANAVNLTVNTDLNCTTVTSGTVAGGTASAEPNGTCGGTANNDVWYTFTATATTHVVSLVNLAGSTTDMYMSIFEGTCAALTELGCSDPNTTSVNGLTVGTQYTVRVYTWNSDPLADSTFDICIGTLPPPPANDECANAIDLTVNTDLSCTAVTAGTIAGGTASAEPNGACNGTANNDVWYTFTATADLHSVSLENLVGSTTDMYMSIFEGTCATLTEVVCSDPESASVNGLTIGTQYTIRVYTWGSNPVSDTNFDICIGTPPPPITTDITTYTPEQLIEDVLVDADCATVTNIQYETHSTDANDIGFSYFTDGGSNFPFENGIILSSGKATDAAGPFSGTGPSHGGDGPVDSDADLENVTGVTNTFDRVFIEFDFVPIAPQISFNYLMASTEYNGGDECNYADSFAFILTHIPTGTTTNLAKLPNPDNGNDNVVVTNIHPAVGTSCVAENEAYFGGYTAPSAEIAYGGRTVPLTAFSSVIAGDQYHIKLVMADQGDSILDTAIFLEGGSFSLGSVDLGDDVFLGDPGALCEGDIKVLNAGVLPVGAAIQWFKDGVEIPGETTVNPVSGDTEQILTIDVTGDYSSNVYFVLAPDCSRESSVHIEFYPNPKPDLGNDVIVCANEALTLEANVGNSTDPNMGPLNYIWEYKGVIVQNGPDSTYVINPTTVIASTNTASGSVQYVNPVDGSTEFANVVYSVNNVANGGVYHLGEFTVTVVDTITLCSGTSTFNVSYFENANCVSIPSGISPNGDGVNDCLVLDHLSPNNEEARLQVFNRYGTRVYDRASHIKEWCGTNQEGNALVTGTYYYILDFTNGALFKGWIYINVED